MLDDAAIGARRQNARRLACGNRVTRRTRVLVMCALRRNRERCGRAAVHVPGVAGAARERHARKRERLHARKGGEHAGSERQCGEPSAVHHVGQ